MTNNITWAHKDEFSAAPFQKWENYGEFKQVSTLTFVRVYQAGHLVPMDQPAGAFDLLEKFIKGWAVPLRNQYVEDN